MHRKALIILASLGLILIVILALAVDTNAPARAQDQPDSYSLSWWTADGGGGSSQAGPYRVTGTIGQPDAAALSSGSFTIVSGFWSPAQSYRLFVPIVSRQ
jgi:hypothetical protein